MRGPPHNARHFAAPPSYLPAPDHRLTLRERALQTHVPKLRMNGHRTQSQCQSHTFPSHVLTLISNDPSTPTPPHKSMLESFRSVPRRRLLYQRLALTRVHFSHRDRPFTQKMIAQIKPGRGSSSSAAMAQRKSLPPQYHNAPRTFSSFATHGPLLERNAPHQHAFHIYNRTHPGTGGAVRADGGIYPVRHTSASEQSNSS